VTTPSVVVLSGAVGGSFSLTKDGASVLTLGGANTFTGGVTVALGTVRVGNNAALGTGDFSMATGTTLSSDSTAARVLANDYTFDGVVTLGDATNTGVLTLSGVGTLGSNTTVTASSAVVLSGAVGGAFLLTKDGASSLTLGVANTFTGGVTVQGGAGSVLRIGHDTALGTGTLTLNTAGVVVSSDSGTARALGNGFTIGANVTLGDATPSLNGALTFGGTGAITTAATVATESAVTWNGVVSGTGNWTKAGTGELTLGGCEHVHGDNDGECGDVDVERRGGDSGCGSGDGDVAREFEVGRK